MSNWGDLENIWLHVIGKYRYIVQNNLQIV